MDILFFTKLKLVGFSLFLLVCVSVSAQAQRHGVPVFNKSKDMLVAHFDAIGDRDDIHAMAAVGSMMAHNDLSGTNVLAVLGTRSPALKHHPQFRPSALLDAAFGKENWLDAIKVIDSPQSVASKRVRDALVKRVVAALNKTNDSRVYVLEGGMSDFTDYWLRALINQKNGVGVATVKSRVVVVQHSWYNEKNTTRWRLENVIAKANYIQVDDGNFLFGNGVNNWVIGDADNRGANTARLQGRGDDKKGVYNKGVRNGGHPKWINAARSSSNNKVKARQLWILADDYVKNNTRIGRAKNTNVFKEGGTDYSDTVSLLWIIGRAYEIKYNRQFWARYVSSVNVDQP